MYSIKPQDDVRSGNFGWLVRRGHHRSASALLPACPDRGRRDMANAQHTTSQAQGHEQASYGLGRCQLGVSPMPTALGGAGKPGMSGDDPHKQRNARLHGDDGKQHRFVISAPRGTHRVFPVTP